ncbi:hypothetical protein BH10ACT2_BH10ACT2_06770 [soil metagenome]
MLLWFLGTGLVTVWFVFTDPRFDYRLLFVGVLLPDIIDAPFGNARWAHSLTVTVGALALVMLVTAGRKPIRRLLLGLPIGMLLHLVWDGAFTATNVFWWPFSGGWGNTRVPSLERGWLNLVLELIGAAIAVWAWRRFGLADPDRRREFLRSGVLRERT